MHADCVTAVQGRVNEGLVQMLAWRWAGRHRNRLSLQGKHRLNLPIMSIPAQPTFGRPAFQTVNRKKHQQQPGAKQGCRSPALKKASQQTGHERHPRKDCKANRPISFPKKTPDRVVDRWGVLIQRIRSDGKPNCRWCHRNQSYFSTRNQC